MKITKQYILDDPEVIFDSDKDQGIVHIELDEEFHLLIMPARYEGEPVLNVMLEARGGVGRLIVYPSVTNAIMLGEGKL